MCPVLFSGIYKKVLIMTKAKDTEENKEVAESFKLIAINTVGNHSPGTEFDVETKTQFDRLLGLGAAKKAPEKG